MREKSMANLSICREANNPHNNMSAHMRLSGRASHRHAISINRGSSLVAQVNMLSSSCCSGLSRREIMRGTRLSTHDLWQVECSNMRIYFSARTVFPSRRKASVIRRIERNEYPSGESELSWNDWCITSLSRPRLRANRALKLHPTKSALPAKKKSSEPLTP